MRCRRFRGFRRCRGAGSVVATCSAHMTHSQNVLPSGWLASRSVPTLSWPQAARMSRWCAGLLQPEDVRRTSHSRAFYYGGGRSGRGGRNRTMGTAVDQADDKHLFAKVRIPSFAPSWQVRGSFQLLARPSFGHGHCGRCGPERHEFNCLPFPPRRPIGRQPTRRRTQPRARSSRRGPTERCRSAQRTRRLQ